MNSATHPVAPEQIMALLDGELAAEDAQAVSTHVGHCSECANLAAQLRSTSESLSAWQVPAIPARLEESITKLAVETGSGLKTGRAGLFIRSWAPKHWAVAAAGVIAALLLAITIPPRTLRQRAPATAMDKALEVGGKPTESDGSIGKLQRNSPPAARSGSGSLESRVDSLSAPGIAPDSNGLFHGLGDHVENSSSVDGQPRTDQQSKVASAPMIARTVSLSIFVKDLAASRATLDTILARHHGYSAELTVSTPEDAPHGLQASLRIPEPELSSAVGDLRLLGRVENESQSGEEVTRQHADLVARLKNARDTEDRFHAILQQRTGNVAEVLQVEEGIARVRGDIERMEAEQKGLEHRVDFGTVELQLTEEYKAQLNPPTPSVSIRLHNAGVAGYQNATETLLEIVLFFAEYSLTILIWLVILTLPAGLLRRRYRKALDRL